MTPALSVIDEFQKRSGIEIVFVGRRHAIDSDLTPSFEYREVTKRRISFIHLPTGRLTRILSLQSLFNIAKIPSGFLRAYKIVSREKPDCIISFGGYIALPVGIAGFFLRIPVYVHEQTIHAGITNKLLGKFSRRIFVGFPQAANYFNRKKTVISGNPVREAVFTIQKRLFDLSYANDKKVIYVTGGSLGSHSLNIHVENILTDLLKNFIIIHQCGENSYRDFERLSKINHEHYFVKKHFFDDEIGFIFSVSDMVVSRAGANTITELVALEKPAVLIPLPYSAGGEQKEQALWLKDMGVAEVHFQNRPARDLFSKIETISNDLENYRMNFKNINFVFKKDSAKVIVDSIYDDIAAISSKT